MELKMKHIRATLFMWVALVAFGGLTPASTAAQCADCVFPGDEWTILRGPGLAQAGWDVQALRGVTRFLADSANSTGVVVAHKGRLVYTFGDIEELSYLASVRKSILSMLYGYWVENGTIDLSATMEDIGVDDVGGLLPIEKQAQIGHLITARSGVYHPASNGGDNLGDAPCPGFAATRRVHAVQQLGLQRRRRGLRDAHRAGPLRRNPSADRDPDRVPGLESPHPPEGWRPLTISLPLLSLPPLDS